jgi:hypothetical protein
MEFNTRLNKIGKGPWFQVTAVDLDFQLASPARGPTLSRLRVGFNVPNRDSLCTGRPAGPWQPLPMPPITVVRCQSAIIQRVSEPR